MRMGGGASTRERRTCCTFECWGEDGGGHQPEREGHVVPLSVGVRMGGHQPEREGHVVPLSVGVRMGGGHQPEREGHVVPLSVGVRMGGGIYQREKDMLYL